MSKFEVTLKAGKSDHMRVFKAGRIKLCRGIMEELFSIPEDTKEIVVIVNDKETKNSYKVMNDYTLGFWDDEPREYPEEDEDITLIHSDGGREHYSMFPKVKKEFLKRVGIPCYVSVQY